MDQEMPLSPFLPGTKIQYAWDSTSLGYLKTCPRLYQYCIIEGWAPKEDSIHLRFGGEYHQAIHDFETAKASGASFEDSLRHAVQQLLFRIRDWDPDPTIKAYEHKNKESLVHLVVAYCDHYRDDPFKTLILENDRPAVELSFKFNIDFGPHSAPDQGYLLCGHLDRVVVWQGSNFVLDHKTTTQTPTDWYFNQFTPNNQMTLYTIAGEVILETTISGVIIEAAQVTKDKPMKFERRPAYRNSDVTDEWMDDLEYHLFSAENYAQLRYWPQNDTACDKFGGCRFREVCSKAPKVREAYLKADFIQLPEEERWNPLKAR